MDECLQWMREGDTLAVTKIDHLARSARDLHNKVAKELGICVASIYNALKEA